VKKIRLKHADGNDFRRPRTRNRVARCRFWGISQFWKKGVNSRKNCKLADAQTKTAGVAASGSKL
ncbi:hypothetical protein, partial [Roseibium sp.]|uniref:hypothetical protein n=1 Tax=Roseibium sp. TaxID=1936156 RepID=UPI0025DEA726